MEKKKTNIVHFVQNIEDEIEFRLRTKRTQTILNAYFIKA